MDWLLAIDSAAPEQDARPHTGSTLRVAGRSVVLMLATQLASIARIAGHPDADVAGATVDPASDTQRDAQQDTRMEPTAPSQSEPTAGNEEGDHTP